jgi:hypothetical protein
VYFLQSSDRQFETLFDGLLLARGKPTVEFTLKPILEHGKAMDRSLASVVYMKYARSWGWGQNRNEQKFANVVKSANTLLM